MVSENQVFVKTSTKLMMALSRLDRPDCLDQTGDSIQSTRCQQNSVKKSLCRDSNQVSNDSLLWFACVRCGPEPCGNGIKDRETWFQMTPNEHMCKFRDFDGHEPCDGITRYVPQMCSLSPGMEATGCSPNARWQPGARRLNCQL